MKNLLFILAAIALVFGGGAVLAQQITPVISVIAMAVVAGIALVVGNMNWTNVIFGSNNTISNTTTKNIYIQKAPKERGIKRVKEE